jgi:hypothetical protein
MNGSASDFDRYVDGFFLEGSIYYLLEFYYSLLSIRRVMKPR